jgi:hypothetical protein
LLLFLLSYDATEEDELISEHASDDESSFVQFAGQDSFFGDDGTNFLLQNKCEIVL